MNILFKLGGMLDHNRITFRFVPYLKETRLAYLRHQLRNKKKKKINASQREEFARFADAHKDEFSRLASMLEDDESRKVLNAVLEYRKTWDYSVIKSVCTTPQYFPKDIIRKDIIRFEDNEVMVDGGAYVGDTIYSFIHEMKKRSGGGGYSHIYAWEPDTRNINAIKKNLSGYNNITVIPCAMYRNKAELHFDSGNNAQSKISDSESGSMIKADSIDNLIKERVTFIKMDLEGAEIDALMGAENTIKMYKPKLAISIYHKPEHLYSIAFLIKSFVPEYRLYIRHHTDEMFDTVLYAVI